MLRETYPYYLANEARSPNTDLAVTDKYTGEVAARVAMADASAIDEAIGAADAVQGAMAELPPYERQQVLAHCVDRFEARHEELSLALCVEAGKPIKDARGEVTRLIDTFRVAAEEAVRLDGETLNLEISARARGYRGFTKRVPIGPCSFISPFNFPLNLAAHKIAPAIAAGCPFVLKPASRTPLGAILIGEVLAETSLPRGAFSILPCSRDGADLFTTDERLKLLSFTGSPGVGWDLKARAGKKPVVLELGGNAACVVDADTDLDDAVDRIVFGAFYQSGQSCISVQRVFAHRAIFEPLLERLVPKAKGLVVGDPHDSETFVGPMIAEEEAERVHDWINEAVKQGATLHCGGPPDGALLPPAILTDVPRDLPIWAEEAFGPVFCMTPFDDFDEALAGVNDSRFGLQVGVFTRDLDRAFRAYDRLECGGVVINDVPSMRVDSMPYGGVKDSGIGREGVRDAIHHMTEPRAMILKHAGAD